MGSDQFLRSSRLYSRASGGFLRSVAAGTGAELFFARARDNFAAAAGFNQPGGRVERVQQNHSTLRTARSGDDAGGGFSGLGRDLRQSREGRRRFEEDARRIGCRWSSL